MYIPFTESLSHQIIHQYPLVVHVSSLNDLKEYFSNQVPSIKIGYYTVGAKL